jgi:prophage regulatory protein
MKEQTENPDRIINLKEMSKLLNKHEKTIWRLWSKDGVMPKPLMLNNRTLGWPESVYKKWLTDLNQQIDCEIITTLKKNKTKRTRYENYISYISKI